PGGKARVGQYDYALAPGWGLEATQHLAKEDVLTSFALGIEHFTSDRQTQPPPLRHEQDYLLPEDVAGELVEPRLMSQWLFLAPVLLEGLVADQVNRAVGRRRQREKSSHD